MLSTSSVVSIVVFTVFHACMQIFVVKKFLLVSVTSIYNNFILVVFVAGTPRYKKNPPTGNVVVNVISCIFVSR